MLCFKPPTGGYNGKEVSDTFVFLGFTHFWARSRKGYWVIKGKTAKELSKKAVVFLTPERYMGKIVWTETV
jgi:aryl-phospho-beta-D-glucosidase BglC (GH1 family)